VLKHIKAQPKRALGFDFDGAEFSHVDSKVTFEVLLASFSLDTDIGLSRLGSLVHFLDVGGIPVAEQPDSRQSSPAYARCQVDDDALLKRVSPMLDGLVPIVRDFRTARIRQKSINGDPARDKSARRERR